MSKCYYKHPEDFCTLKKGDCPYQSELMKCLAKEENLTEYCPDCFSPFDDLGECDCMKFLLTKVILKDGTL